MNALMNMMTRVAAVLAVMAPFATAALAQESNLALVHRLMLEQRMAVIEADADELVAQLGQRLASGDRVVTSSNTRAAIRFTDDGSLVRLNPSSELLVRSEGDRGALTKTLELEFGELWARVTEQRGVFQVQTPSGVAAVKGTEFIVRVDPTGATTVLTLEGALDFFNGAGTVEILAGRQGTTTDANTLVQVVDIEDDDLEGLDELVEDDADDEIIRIEIPVQNAEGVQRTVILEVSRGEAQALVSGGRR